MKDRKNEINSTKEVALAAKSVLKCTCSAVAIVTEYDVGDVHVGCVTCHKRLCMQHRRDFVPFIASCAGNLGPHAKKVLQRLSQSLATKWSQPYSSVAHYVNSRISISLVRSTRLHAPVARRSNSTLVMDICDMN